MLRHLKIRRAATTLHAAHPEIPLPVARARAWQMVRRYPRATTQRVGEYLIHDVRVRRLLANLEETS